MATGVGVVKRLRNHSATMDEGVEGARGKEVPRNKNRIEN